MQNLFMIKIATRNRKERLNLTKASTKNKANTTNLVVKDWKHSSQDQEQDKYIYFLYFYLTLYWKF